MNVTLLFLVLLLFVGCGHSGFKNKVFHDLNQLIVLQERVDEGHKVGYLDPQNVAMEFVQKELSDSGPFFDINVRKEKKGFIKVELVSSKASYSIEVFRPIRFDKTGILVVGSYEVVEAKKVPTPEL